MADTKRQEQASLVTFYYAIEKGANLGTIQEPAIGAVDRDEDLYNAIKDVYPNAFDQNGRWYKAFIKQAIVLVEWMKKGGVSVPTDKYNYGRFGDEKIKGIPDSSMSTIGDEIYNSFTPEQKKLYGSRPSKDSWNPMDVFVVKKNDEDEIIKEIQDSCCFEDRIAPQDEESAQMEIISLNQYMAYMADNRIFVGISLKETDYGDPKVTETNIKKGFDHIHHSCGMITKPLNMTMEIVGIKGAGTKKEKKGLNFLTNSLTYEAEFNIGNVLKKYKYESKISSRMSHATEPRDLTQGVRGGFVPAKARNGAVPEAKMATIVKKYSKQDINANIPMDGNFTSTDRDKWVTILKAIKSGGKTTKPKLGKFNIHINQKGKKWWTNMNVDEYMDKAIELDNDFPKKTEKYPTALRNKLRAARYILMFQEAESDGLLDNLIAELYFSSSKINMDKKDLSGPFVKIQ